MSGRAPRRALVLVLDGVHALDLAGPVQALATPVDGTPPFSVALVGESERVRAAQGFEIGGLGPLPEPRAEDLILVPGLASARLPGLARRASGAIAWLAAAAGRGAAVGSVCAGAFALGEAGLLDGRRCTTHWSLTARLARAFPRAEVVEDRLYLFDGPVFTSAGISAGLDLALALIERLAGPRASACVARDLVAPVRRSGDEQQLSAYLRFRDHLEPGVHRAQDLIAQDPAAALKLTALARAVGMSERNLARRFREATGLSPGQYRTMLRLELAARLLKESGLSLDEVAAQSGWSDVRQLRRHWAREQGGSLRAARRR